MRPIYTFVITLFHDRLSKTHMPARILMWIHIALWAVTHMKALSRHFSSRQELISYVSNLSPHATGQASPIVGGHDQASLKLSAIKPIDYGRTRNYGNGHITRLSPYIHHGLITLEDTRLAAMKHCSQAVQITKFLQELAWRDFWQRLAMQRPQWLWHDCEPYKTGFCHSDYADHLPEDIQTGTTGVVCLDMFIKELLESGYIHNHARMYIASYVVHFRRVKWQAGAKWFLAHLLDGNEASNNFSWQWVASTFSNKPYIFNLDNVHKYFGDQVNTTPADNVILDADYDQLEKRLFPHKDAQ